MDNIDLFLNYNEGIAWDIGCNSQVIMNHLDLFSGIGGFSLGLQQAGIEPDWIGYSDIDKYANELIENLLFKEITPIVNKLKIASINNLFVSSSSLLEII